MSFHPQEFKHCQTALECLTQAQHHGLPTRLLDVSLNCLAGLYFAVESHDELDGEVIRFDVHSSRIKGFSSDALSCICNFSKLNFDEQKEIQEYLASQRKEYGAIGKIPVNAFNKLKPVMRLIQFVKQEKPYFESRIKPIDLWNSYLAMPMRNSRRVTAQSGAFIVSGILKRPTRSTKINVEKILIPKEKKKFIRVDLDKMGINRMTIYPDLENAAKHIARSWASI